MGTGYEELHVGDKVEDKSQRFSSIFEQTISWKVRRLSSAYHKYYVWSSKLQAAFVLELIRYKGFMTCATLRQYLGIIVECVHKHNLIAQSQAVAPGETSLSYINTWSIRCLTLQRMKQLESKHSDFDLDASGRCDESAPWHSAAAGSFSAFNPVKLEKKDNRNEGKGVFNKSL